MAFRCSPYHTTSALYPVITHIERLLQFEPDDLPETKLAKLEAGLRPYGLPLAGGAAVGRVAVGAAADGMLCTADAGTAATEAANAGRAGRVAGGGGRAAVLVAWEDLHWADPTTLEVLGLVLEQGPPCRCCTC